MSDLEPVEKEETNNSVSLKKIQARQLRISFGVALTSSFFVFYLTYVSVQGFDELFEAFGDGLPESTYLMMNYGAFLVGLPWVIFLVLRQLLYPKRLGFRCKYFQNPHLKSPTAGFYDFQLLKRIL